MLLFFSLAGSKRPVYLVPMFPPLALALGCFLDGITPRERLTGALTVLRRFRTRMAFTVTTAALALGLDPGHPGLMQRPPRSKGEGVITRRMWMGIFYVGLIMAAGTLVVLDASLPGGFVAGSGDLRYAQTMTFTTLMMFQMFNVFNARSDDISAFTRLFTNLWLWAAVGLSVVLQVAVVYVPVLQKAFSTTGLSAGDWALCTAVASAVLWLGVLLFLAVLVHKLPEGVTISSMMLAGGQSRTRAVASAAGLGLTTLGFYDRAYRIASWPNLLLTTIMSRIGFLTFNKVRDDRPRLTHAVRLSLWVLLTLGLPIASVLFFGAADIVKILYTDRYNESAYFLHFLTIYTLVWPFVSIGFWLSVALGHHRQTVLFTLAQAFTLILVGTPFTLVWGVNGTLAAVSITMLLAVSLSLRYMLRQVDLAAGKIFGAHLLAAGITAGSLFLLQLWPGWSTLFSLIRLGLIGLISFGAFGFILYVLRPQEIIDHVQYIKRAFPAVQEKCASTLNQAV